MSSEETRTMSRRRGYPIGKPLAEEMVRYHIGLDKIGEEHGKPIFQPICRTLVFDRETPKKILMASRPGQMSGWMFKDSDRFNDTYFKTPLEAWDNYFEIMSKQLRVYQEIVAHTDDYRKKAIVERLKLREGK